MAAPVSERLFSLELLVDWVRLEAGLPPPPPPPSVAEIEEEQEDDEEEEEASLPRMSRGLCPAVAFRLLDFPTLLVYPPDGPGAPVPEPQPGLVRFGRGKSCLFRLHPATLHGLLRQKPLHALLLQLPPGRPTPAPRLLGACSVSLAAAAHKVLGQAAASGCSQGHRGRFPLHNQVGERIGDIALCYRLTDLGSSLLGHLERPGATTAVGMEGVAVSAQTPQEKQRPNPEPLPSDAKSLLSLKIPKAHKDLKEVAFRSKTNSGNTVSVEHCKTSSLYSDSGGRRNVSPPNQELTGLDIEANIFCPPPLYYTHLTQEKTPPVQGTVTIKPQINAPEELDGIFLEGNHVDVPAHSDSLKHTNSGTHGGPPKLINPPHVQDIRASNQTAGHVQTEQSRIDTIRQLPLLNALLVELSLLYNRPVAGPTQIHPHLAWLYRTEEKKSPESSAKCTCKSESKKGKLSMGENDKSAHLQYKKNQVENLKKGKYFEKNSGNPPKRGPRGKLLYGLTNTLKLRLKQTNPGMLVVHEKREQYRKMQAQMLGAKLRIPSSKVKVFSFAEQPQEPHQLPKEKCSELEASFAENSDTSKQFTGSFDDPSTAKETKLKCATEKTVECGAHRTNNGLLEKILSPPNSIVPERFTHAGILEREMERKTQSPCVFQQVAVVDSIVIDKEIVDKHVKITDEAIYTDDMSESKPSRNSSSESISELKYSDDFTSLCFSEEISTTDDTSRILQAHGSSLAAENPKHNQDTSKSSETRPSERKNSSEKSSVLSPPFSAGSPVHSHKRSHISRIPDKSLEEDSSISTSDLSVSHWTEEKENQMDRNSLHNSKVVKLKTKVGCKSPEKSQSPRTSQVSSYLPSNFSELELNVLDSSIPDHLEEDDEVDSLSISKQCRDICELVINKLPGYTM
ncbi:microtubule-associated protein 10 [Suricata suricatta]|uniref:Microtubule associated protein 10 n=1 Tax=Suricata suricatta TaxID=37032 RepID=A0A673T8K3_SURSU|nr:microtubule-associated protein 10 [Suricata suricatta]